jgi:hypothetical protein
MDIQEMIDIIRQSGYEVQRVDTSEQASLKRSRNGRRNIKRGHVACVSH